MCSRCAYVPVLCKMLEFKYHETQTISYLCIRGKDECDICRGRELNKNRKRRSTKRERGTWFLDIHVRSACCSLVASRGWVRSMVFAWIDFSFARYLFCITVCEPVITINVTVLHNGTWWISLQALRLSMFSDLDFLHFSKICTAQYKALNKLKFFSRNLT